MSIFKFKKINNKKGFTLVEMLVAVALFTLVASFSIGAGVSIFYANRKARSSKTVVDNLNLSLENISRIIRFSSNYYCGVSANPESKYDGSNCDAVSVKFIDKGVTKRIVYSLYVNAQGRGTIQRSDNGGVSYTNITSPDTNIQQLKFYVFNTLVADAQPYVVAVIKGYVGERSTSQSSFSIETAISQRVLDII